MAGVPTPRIKLNTPTIVNGDIIGFLWEQKKEGKAEETMRTRGYILNRMAKANDLNNPEEIKEFLVKNQWNNRTKTRAIDTYNAYLRYKKITWQAPKYKIAERFPFIPTEQEIDLLISATGKQTSTALQTLKETGARIGELCQLKWIDIDLERKTANITPEKGSNPRILPISDKLIAMINKLPRNRETLFQPNSKILREYFCKQRKEIAEKLQNPRLRKISFHTLRHWKGTMEYHKTQDIMHVKYVLGHKTINCTLIYINLEQTLFLTSTDDWIVKIAHNEAEELKLIEASFIFVNKREEPYTAFYKKRK